MYPSIQLYSGRVFDFLNPNPEDIVIEDVAHALSQVCRFGGHCRDFYSVAQHAVLVSFLAPVEHCWDALHHDNAEAFIGDIPTPLKKILPDFKEVELRVETAIAEAFGRSIQLPSPVKKADLQALWLEKESLVDDHGLEWTCFGGDFVPPTFFKVKPLKPKDAEKLFLHRYYELLEGQQ